MKKTILSTILLGLITASCDSYLDINIDPNSPSESNITSSVMMPGAEMNLAATYGDYFRIVGGYYSQHFAQAFGAGNYLDYSRFTQSATRSSSAYTQLNQRAIKSFVTIQSKAANENDWGTYLAATVLKAFSYQALVDAYGEVPYSEAMDVSNTSPKYDDGVDVYAGILAEIDEALSKVSSSDAVATNFLFPGESAGSWIKFANALKLRILTRESGVVDVNSKIAALVQENNFPKEDVAYAGCWSSESGSESPYYAEEYATNWGSTQVNVIANIAIVGTMQTEDYTDPRLAAWVNTNDNGNIVGGISGSNFSNSSSYKSSYWCRPKASYDMPVYLISLADINFYIAEYYAKNNNPAQAEAYYNAAIAASFEQAGVSDAEECIARNPYDHANWKRCIGIAHWISTFGTDDFEGYCEVRRLGYPSFGKVTGDQLYDNQTDASYSPEKYEGGYLYTPIQVFGQVGNNNLLQRWPYAEASSTRNSNTPDFKGYTTPIFWAQ